MLHESMTHPVTLTREGREIKFNAYIQSAKAVFAKFDVDAQEGDVFSSPNYPEVMVVKSVHRSQAPPSMSGGELDHARIELVTRREWERSQGRNQSPSQIFNIENVGNMAGRDLYSISIDSTVFLAAMKERIQNDNHLTQSEKKTMLEKVADFALNPKIWEIAASVLSGMMKS